MTDAGWAERKVAKAATCPDGVNVVYAPTATKLLLAEHQRAVRVVKALEKAATLGQYDMNEAVKRGFLYRKQEATAALQKGRT